MIDTASPIQIFAGTETHQANKRGTQAEKDKPSNKQGKQFMKY